MSGDVALAHISDLHFGGHADLPQLEALGEFLATLGATAVVVSGDLTQRARHGEFQAAHLFIRRIRGHTPALVIPGNHDIQWWRSPFGLAGERAKYAKYTRYFGPELRPVLEVPGAVIAGALSSYGLALGSLTWSLNDLAVKGHLPEAETDRVGRLFASVPKGVVRVLVTHHNMLAGALSHRMGLAHWRSAHRRLVATGADVILCGHDHQEGAGQIEGGIAVSTAGTHSFRSRHGRPSVFNLVRVEPDAIRIQHYRYDAGGRRFLRSDAHSFARTGEKAVVSVAGGDQPL